MYDTCILEALNILHHLIREMMQFVNSVSEWLAANELNVIAVHCKGGKGRTGKLLLYIYFILFIYL